MLLLLGNLVRSFARRRRMYTLAIDIYLPTLKNVVHSNPIIYITFLSLFIHSLIHTLKDSPQPHSPLELGF